MHPGLLGPLEQGSISPGRAFVAFLGYGYAWTEYVAADDAFGLWFDEPVQRYHPPHDRRHQVNALASVDVAGFTASARWHLGSGLPFTRPMGFEEAFDYTRGCTTRAGRWERHG